MRQALSFFVTEARGSYHKRDDRPETITVHVSRERLEALVSMSTAVGAQEREALAGIDYHEVVYERDLEDASKHQQTMTACSTFSRCAQARFDNDAQGDHATAPRGGIELR